MSPKLILAVAAVLGIAAVAALLFMGGDPSPEDAVEAQARTGPQSGSSSSGGAGQAGQPLGNPPGEAGTDASAGGVSVSTGLPGAGQPAMPVEGDANIDYTALRPFFAEGDWPGVNPRELGTQCAPPPCVINLAWSKQAEGYAEFRQALHQKLFEMGEGRAQPSMAFAEDEGGTERAWVYWVPGNVSPAESEALNKQAGLHVTRAGGPGW